MGAHGPGAAFWTPGIALVGVGVGVVFYLVVPGLDVEGRRAVSVESMHRHTQTNTHRQTNSRLSQRPTT